MTSGLLRGLASRQLCVSDCICNRQQHFQHIKQWNIHTMHARARARTRALTQTHTHTHTCLTAFLPGLPGWAGTRKVKPIRILLKQETVSGSGTSWAICKSALRSRKITMPAPHHSVFYRPDALPATQPTASKHWMQKHTYKLQHITTTTCIFQSWHLVPHFPVMHIPLMHFQGPMFSKISMSPQQSSNDCHTTNTLEQKGWKRTWLFHYTAVLYECIVHK